MTRALFTYPDFGTPVCNPDHVAHSGQTVTVESKLDRSSFDFDDIKEDIFVVRADDGWTAQVFESELSEEAT